MVEIKENMYVRTKKGIAKILSKRDDVRYDYPNAWETDTFLEIYDDTEYIYEEDIIGEPSFNIMNVLKPGDILHSKSDDQYWTIESYLYEKGKCVNIEWEVLDSEEEFLENIDEIITKEQAKSVSYKVGE